MSLQRRQEEVLRGPVSLQRRLEEVLWRTPGVCVAGACGRRGRSRGLGGRGYALGGAAWSVQGPPRGIGAGCEGQRDVEQEGVGHEEEARQFAGHGAAGGTGAGAVAAQHLRLRAGDVRGF